MAARIAKISIWTLAGLAGALILALAMLALNPVWLSRPAEKWVRSYLEANPLAESARMEFRSITWKPLRGLEVHGIRIHRGDVGLFLGSAELSGLGWRRGRLYADRLILDSLLVSGIPDSKWLDWFSPWTDPSDTSSSGFSCEIGEVELGFWARNVQGDTLIAPSKLRIKQLVWASNSLGLDASLGLDLPGAGLIEAKVRMDSAATEAEVRWSNLLAEVKYSPKAIRIAVSDDSSNAVVLNAYENKNEWVLPEQGLQWGQFEAQARGRWGDLGRELELRAPGLALRASELDGSIIASLTADSTKQTDGSKWLLHGGLEAKYSASNWAVQGKNLNARWLEQRAQFTSIDLSGTSNRWRALVGESTYGSIEAQGDYDLGSVALLWRPLSPIKPLEDLPAVHRVRAQWSALEPYSLVASAEDSLATVARFKASQSSKAWNIEASWGSYRLKALFKRSPDQWNFGGSSSSDIASQLVAGKVPMLDSLGLTKLDASGASLQVHLENSTEFTRGSAKYLHEGRIGRWDYLANASKVRHEFTWDGPEKAVAVLTARPGDSLKVQLTGLANHPRGGELKAQMQIWPYGSKWTGRLIDGYGDAWYKPEDGDSLRIHGILQGASRLSYDFDKGRLALDEALFWNCAEGQLALDGAWSPIEGEFLSLRASGLNLPFWTKIAGLEQFEFGGSVSLDAKFMNRQAGWAVSGGLQSENLSMKQQPLGVFSLGLDFVPDREAADLSLRWDHGDTAIVHVNGSYGVNGLEAVSEQISIPVRWARPFAEGAVNALDGRIKGRAQCAANSDFTNLRWEGSGVWSNAGLTIPALGLGLRGTAPWVLGQKSLKMGPSRFADHRGVGSAEVSVNLNFEAQQLVDLRFKTEGMVVMDLPPSPKADFYGYVVASGAGDLTGSASSLRKNVSAKSIDSSVFVLPLDAPVSLEEVKFLTFRSRAEPLKPQKRNSEDFKFDLHLDLEVTEDILAQLILDETLGDVIEARGTGLISLDVPWVGDMMLRGNLTMDRGTYLFTLGNLINKPFSLVPGGTIRWTGDPYAAQLNLTALYRTRADVKDYLSLPDAGRQNLDVRLTATGPLFQPQLAFDIGMPNAGEIAQAALASRLSYSDERTTQVLSLLTISSFWLGSSPLSAQGMQAVESNTTQVLASQFSNFVTQGLGADWDVNLAYSNNSAAAQREMEASIGKSFLDDRLSIQTEWGIPIGQSQPSIGLGDIEIRYQLSEDGRWSTKAYQSKNNQMLQTGVVGSQRQGVGIRFEQSGTSWRQLLQRPKKD